MVAQAFYGAGGFIDRDGEDTVIQGIIRGQDRGAGLDRAASRRFAFSDAVPLRGKRRDVFCYKSQLTGGKPLRGNKRAAGVLYNVAGGGLGCRKQDDSAARPG